MSEEQDGHKEGEIDFAETVYREILHRANDHPALQIPFVQALLHSGVENYLRTALGGPNGADADTVEKAIRAAADSVRKNLTELVELAISGHELADRIDGAGSGISDAKLQSLGSTQLKKLGIRSHRAGEFDIEIRIREILRHRPDVSKRDRVLNLIALQDVYHTVGNFNACVDTNQALLEFLDSPGMQDVKEHKLRLGNSLEFYRFRARDLIFAARHQLGEDVEEEAAKFHRDYGQTGTDLNALGIALGKLRTFYSHKRDYPRVLELSLRVALVESRKDDTAAARKSESVIRKCMEILKIKFHQLGDNLEDDLAKLEALDAAAIQDLAGRASSKRFYKAEVSLREAMLKKDLEPKDLIEQFMALLKLYETLLNFSGMLDLAERFSAYLGEISDQETEFGHSFADLRFVSRHGEYRSKRALKILTAEEQKLKQRFYEDHLVSEDCEAYHRFVCLETLGDMYERAGNFEKAWDCAREMLQLPNLNYLDTRSTREAESRRGNRLSFAQRNSAVGVVIATIQARIAEEKRKHAEENKRRNEEEKQRKEAKAKSDLLQLMERLLEECVGFEKGGRFRDMCLIPSERSDGLLSGFDALLEATASHDISTTVCFVRQNLNAGTPFVRKETLSRAINDLRNSITSPLQSAEG